MRLLLIPNTLSSSSSTIFATLFSSNIFHHTSSKHVFSNQRRFLLTPLRPQRSSFASNLNHSSSSPSVMEEESNLGLLSSSSLSPSSSVTVEDKYSKEIEVAVKAVQLACLICQRVQDSLIAKGHDKQVLSKGDSSPVTVAGT